MDSPSKAEIRYTTRTVTQTWDHFVSNQSPTADPQCDILSSFLDVQADDAPPATIEIVTVVNAVYVPTAMHHIAKPSPNPIYGTPSTEVRDRVMIIHSEALTQTIRDVVQFYPGQILTGSRLVIHEPFACLMHHMAEFQDLLKSKKSLGQSNEIEGLLELLQPQYERQYLTARSRLLNSQPTVRFEDIWAFMKPGSLAYTNINGHWVGCVIGESRRLPPKSLEDIPRRWSITFWFLQVHWASDRIGFAVDSVSIDQYDGEKLVTALPIFPSEISDAIDGGARKRKFTERGSKICDIFWGNSKYQYHDGECLDQSKKSFQGRVFVGGTSEEVYSKHDWGDHWVSPAEVMQRKSEVSLTQIEDFLDPKSHNRDLLTEDQLFAISPCLSAFRLSENDWVLISADSIQPVDMQQHVPAPFLSEGKLESILSLVRFFDSNTKISKTGKGAAIWLHGPPGVGKTHTIDYISMQTGRPLLKVSAKEMNPSFGVGPEFSKWFSLTERWNALLVFDHAEFSMFRPYSRETEQLAFLNALERFGGIVFFTTNKLPEDQEIFLSRFTLKLHFPSLGTETRQDIWKALEEKYQNSTRLSPSARTFLHSNETQVNWDGHEMNHCYQAAIALAAANLRAKNDGAEDSLILEVGHFKEAMNAIHEFREHMGELQLQKNIGFPPMGIPPEPYGLRRHVPNDDALSEESDNPFSEREPKLREPVSLPLASDSSLCIPALNRLNWVAFQGAGSNRDLFRKTKFHAIDFLVGEPQIVLQPDKKTRHRRKILARRDAPVSSQILHAEGEDDQRQSASLPERIRINSPAVVTAFSEIHGEQFPGSFLIFKPFASLLYYEQDFRDWAARQEKIIKDEQTKSTQDKPNNEALSDESSESVDLVALREMECLLSFIDNHIKKRQEYLLSPLCKTVAFSDLLLLFNPGDTVIGTDRKQAYRVIGVTQARHRIKKPDDKDSKFWKDPSKAEYVDNPVIVHCVHVDFDGISIGPVQTTFSISRFDGQKDVMSLQVFPLRFAGGGDLRASLIERAKKFLELAAIKHMHCTGFTLEPREEIDSQVVIDFEEAISRHPKWKPQITSDTHAPDPDEGPEEARKKAEQEYFPQPQNMRQFEPKPVNKCVKECCRSEKTHHEEYVGDRKREEYIASQMGDNPPITAPVTLIPRALKNVNKQNPLTDDELLVVSHCVFGFALRYRKWYKLDMASLVEVSVLGEGEGFDQLVLPEGHGDMVKSMIRQHFREKKLSAGKVASPDIVRGKGRGLIMLLHGVPGVGKTSTAECIADLFRRPLFQITSGDLGLSAKAVEDTLNDNFNLASRWNSVLLIDEADVFLGERTREDFDRNSLVAVFLRMMEYYSGVLFLTTNRVGVFDEAFTSRIHISLYYPPLDRDSTRKVFEKNGERIQARYKSNGRLIDMKMSEITDFADKYFDENKEGRWNGRQIRNAFQSAVALAELDASGTEDLFSEEDHGQPVVLGKKSFLKVAHVYKSFLAYLKQVHGADYARRARENLWRFDAFGAPRIPNALTIRLAVADPTPPPRGPEPPRTDRYQEPWYGYREPSYPSPRQQDHPHRYGYDYSSQRPRGGPPPEHYRETPRGMDSQQSGYHAPSTRADDPRSEGYRDARGSSQPSPRPEWAGHGGAGAGSGGYQTPTRHDPQHSQAHYPSGSGHLSPFQGHDR